MRPHQASVNALDPRTFALGEGESQASCTLQVHYYAVLREQRGCSEEQITTTSTTPQALYSELAARHGFHLPMSRLRVAVNSKFSDWTTPLNQGDTVVFIPPVAGG
jgi:molybdopterin converting factor subunit 1